MQSVEWSKVITSVVTSVVTSVITSTVTVVFLGAGAVLWKGATTVDEKVNAAKESLSLQSDYLKKAIEVIEEEVIKLREKDNAILLEISKSEDRIKSYFDPPKATTLPQVPIPEELEGEVVDSYLEGESVVFESYDDSYVPDSVYQLYRSYKYPRS